MSTDDTVQDMQPFKVEMQFREKKQYVKKETKIEVVQKVPLNDRFVEKISREWIQV